MYASMCACPVQTPHGETFFALIGWVVENQAWGKVEASCTITGKGLISGKGLYVRGRPVRIQFLHVVSGSAKPLRAVEFFLYN